MIKSRIALDGSWGFRHGCETAPERSIEVPGPWQAQFDDLRMKAGIGWYRRLVTLPAGWLAGRIWLGFGAVFHNAQVWVNGTRVGEHEGGFLPFAFDVTACLRESAANEIVVRVESPTDDPGEHPASPLAEVPFGKQSWYGPQSGIWQPVWLERRDPDHVASLHIDPELGTGRVRVTIGLARPLSPPTDIVIGVRDPAGREVAGTVLASPEGEPEARAEALLQLCEPMPWSPDAPNLYRLTVAIRRGGTILDSLDEPFGFRSIEARDGRLYLNGAPLYLRGALDQDYYPEGLCTPPSAAFLEDQIRKAKELGLNCLRCHIKAADPRYYEVADRLGMLIWAELPNMGRTTRGSRARAERLLQGIVDRDRNHPSIVCWTIINENWGTDLVHDPEHRAWLKRCYGWLKAYDPSRLVVDNSPLAPSAHVQTDIADFHYYAAIPDHREAWDRFVAELASRPRWLFSRTGDAIETGTEPLICSEFGNWGLPHPEDLLDAAGREPWWFETGHDWCDGAMYAHGVQNRFADWSLDRAFGSLRGFVEAAQWQQFRALKYQIEAMRRQAALAGYVITELTDCHWESNGLLDMRRNPRAFHGAFRAINADTVVVPRWDRLAYWSGETARIGLAVAHGAGTPLEGTRLEIFLSESQVVPVPRLAAGEVADLGCVALRLPATEDGCRRRALFELRARDGRILATNHLELAVFPDWRGPAVEGGRVWSADPGIRARLASLGYPLAAVRDEAALVVAAAPDEALADHVRAGGRLLLLPEAEGSLNPFFPHWQDVRVRARAGTVWQGDWASSFAWLRRAGPFAGFPGGPLLDEPFDRVLPTHILLGCDRLDFQARVHAGMVVGWIHKPVALVVERHYGEGRVVVSTFRLFRDAPGADPTATLLLDRLMRLALGAAAPSREPRPALAPV